MVLHVGIGMIGGGLLGWSAGFMAMLFYGGMDFDSMAFLYPPAGAFVGVIGGGLIGAAI